MNTPTLRRLPAVAVLAAVLLPPAVQARAAEPMRNIPIRAFHINRVGGELFLDGHARRQDQENGAIQTRERELFLQEGIETRSTGYIYHPNFLDWNANLRLGATQERLTVNETDFATQGTLLGYNLSALILKEKEYSFRPFASYNQAFQDRDFARSVRINEERHGLEITRKGGIAGSLLGEQIAHDETGDLRDTRRKTNHARLDVTDNRNRDWLTQFTYDVQDTDEVSEFFSTTGDSVEQDLPDRSHELTLSNLWKFGPGREKNTLNGRIRFLDRTGFFENQIFTFDQRLDLIHSDTFSTYYRVLASNDKTEDGSDRVISGEVGFLKKIYKSLDLGGSLLATQNRFIGGTQDSVGGALTAAYRKKTALGQYTSNLAVGHEQTRLESPGGIRFIQGEARTLVGITFSRLSQPNVVGAIEVFNNTRTQQFVEGVDFVTRTTGAFTELARIPTGQILDGQTVLVDYSVQTGRESVYTTDFFNWNQRLRIKDSPFSLYTDFRNRTQELQSGDDPGNLEDQRNILIGADADWKGLTAAVEHEDATFQLSPPYTADRIRVAYRRNISADLDGSVGATAERLVFEDVEQFGLTAEQDRINTLGLNASLTAKLQRNLLLRLRTDFFRTRGRQNSLLSRTTAALEWRYGKVDFTAELRHDIFEQEENTGDADSIFITIRRRF